MAEPLTNREWLDFLVSIREMMRTLEKMAPGMDAEFINIRLRNGVTITNDDGEVTCSHPDLGDRVTLEWFEAALSAEGQ